MKIIKRDWSCTAMSFAPGTTVALLCRVAAEDIDDAIIKIGSRLGKH